MDFEENMVEETEAAMEDESFESADMVEEEEDISESLDSLNGEEDEPAEEQPKSQGTSEPGYVQKRIDKALARERENIRAEVMAQVEAQYAPIRDRLLEMDAKELVRQGEFKSVERAKEYLQLKQGISPTATEKPAEQPRQQNGQFAPKQDPVIQAKIDMLAAQADKIKAKTGLDVISVFDKNPDIKDAVVNGEMDFYDVAEQMKGQQKRRPPAPTRSSNGASGQSPNAIDTMSDEQFARMERKIREGARFTLK